MTISYNWLSEYLPQSIDPKKLSEILTSIGLEVESLEFYEKSLKFKLQAFGEKHPTISDAINSIGYAHSNLGLYKESR